MNQWCNCGAAMVQQPLGHWVRTCDHHKQTRYYASVAPLAADLVAFHQLTKLVPRQDGDRFEYGPLA